MVSTHPLATSRILVPVFQVVILCTVFGQAVFLDHKERGAGGDHVHGAVRTVQVGVLRRRVHPRIPSAILQLNTIRLYLILIPKDVHQC